MKRSSKFWPQTKLACGLLFVAGLYLLAGPAAQAQNIDEGKSAQRLFADNCAACHRSPRGLAKGRFRPTLFMFLHDHYTTGSSQAWELASYLASVDTPPRGSRKGATPPNPTQRSALRPPAPVPSAQ